jgi:hypothetical protein
MQLITTMGVVVPVAQVRIVYRAIAQRRPTSAPAWLQQPLSPLAGIAPFYHVIGSDSIEPDIP